MIVNAAILLGGLSPAVLLALNSLPEWAQKQPWIALAVALGALALMFLFAGLRLAYRLVGIEDKARDAFNLIGLDHKNRPGGTGLEIRPVLLFGNRGERRMRFGIEQGVLCWDGVALRLESGPECRIAPISEVHYPLGPVVGPPAGRGQLWFSYWYDTEPKSRRHRDWRCFDIWGESTDAGYFELKHAESDWNLRRLLPPKPPTVIKG